MLRLLVGFLYAAVVQQSLSAHPASHHVIHDQCSISSIPNYTAWLNGSLQIVFNSSEHDPDHCSYVLFRDKIDTYIQVERLNSSDDEFVFPLPKVSKEYDNATMSVVAFNQRTEKQYRQDFTIYTVDDVGAITNLTHSSNCTHTISCWKPPYSHGLQVTDYWHELRLDDEIVESGVTTNLCVVFNLITLPANEPGYSLSVWARAPPGNGTVTNTSIAAATTPNVSYSTDVAMVPQGAIFILVGEVNLSCPTSYPTDVTVSFSCVPGSLPSVRHVYIGTNGSIEIHSNAVETGHIGCNGTVTTSNLSGKNVSELFTFDSTDVQLLDAKPSESVTGAITLWMKLARNSSLLEIVVNVINSHGKLVFSTTANRSLHQREINLTTDILPVDQYTISVLSCYNKSLTISKTVNITHSNYSTPSPSTTVPPSTTTAVPSPTRTPSAPTTTTIIIIASVVVVVVVVVGIIIVGIILYLKRHRKESFNPDNSAINNAAPVQATTTEVHVDDHVIVSSMGSVTMPRTISRGQFTSSLPPPAEYYHSVPQDTATPGSQLLALQNSVPTRLPNSEMVTSQTSQFTTEESIVNSDQALIDTHTQPPPPPPSAVHSTPPKAQSPVQETTTTADSEQPLLPATTKESSSSTYGTVKQTSEEKELSYRVTGEEETNSAIN